MSFYRSHAHHATNAVKDGIWLALMTGPYRAPQGCCHKCADSTRSTLAISTGASQRHVTSVGPRGVWEPTCSDRQEGSCAVCCSCVCVGISLCHTVAFGRQTLQGQLVQRDSTAMVSAPVVGLRTDTVVSTLIGMAPQKVPSSRQLQGPAVQHDSITTVTAVVIAPQ